MHPRQAHLVPFAWASQVIYCPNLDKRGLPCCLPPLGTESASCSIGFSKLNSPAHQSLCLRFKRYLTISPARLEARMDSQHCFPVGLFHPLQHAGLSRRSPSTPSLDREWSENPLRIICGATLRESSRLPTQSIH